MYPLEKKKKHPQIGKSQQKQTPTSKHFRYGNYQKKNIKYTYVLSI